jgi:DDE superfamily endonuclease/Archaeal putative transposase ISC1217
VLLQTWLAMAATWRGAFAQDRSFFRVLWILLGLLSTRGRGTVTSALAMFGLTGRWSADFRAFSRSDWESRALFRGVLHHAAPFLREVPRLVVSLDDTGLPKRSKKIKACSWMHDPLGPRFQTNLVWGLRCLHGMVHLPPQAEGLGSIGLSIGFELAPPPKKPKAGAPKEARSEYLAARKIHGLTARGVAMIKLLRGEFDEEGLNQILLVVGDGGYTNQTLITGLPERVDFIGRARKDTKLCLPSTKPNAIYGELLPTPEEMRKDARLAEKITKCFYGGRNREARFKEVTGLLWQGGGKRRPLRLIIVMPTPYRPPGCQKYKYDQPAYLITTDLISQAQELIQAYLDRWQIEVLHRELKTTVGIGEAQVWSDKSLPRLHPSIVAAYALLKLASLKAFGPMRTADYHELPPWRSQRDRGGVRRPSAHDLLTRLRADMAEKIHGTPQDGVLPTRETVCAA